MIHVETSMMVEQFPDGPRKYYVDLYKIGWLRHLNIRLRDWLDEITNHRFCGTLMVFTIKNRVASIEVTQEVAAAIDPVWDEAEPLLV